MNGTLSNAAALLGKEVRTEFRSRELLSTTIVFVLIGWCCSVLRLLQRPNESHRFGPGTVVVRFCFGFVDVAVVLFA